LNKIKIKELLTYLTIIFLIITFVIVQKYDPFWFLNILIGFLLAIFFIKVNFFLLTKSCKFMLKSKNKKIWFLFFIFRLIIFLIFLGFIFYLQAISILLTFLSLYLIYIILLMLFLLKRQNNDTPEPKTDINLQFI